MDFQGIEVPEEFIGTVFEGCVGDVAARAVLAWKYSALNMMWNDWMTRCAEPDGPELDEAFWMGEGDASCIFNEQIELCAAYVDLQELWLALTGGFDVNGSIRNWGDLPGQYGVVCTCRVFDDFEKVVKAMFPLSAYRAGASRAHVPQFPAPDAESGHPAPGALLEWARAMMEDSGVTAAFAAFREGVPLEDIAC